MTTERTEDMKHYIAPTETLWAINFWDRALAAATPTPTDTIT